MAWPRFITFEGLDGSGKTSHLNRVAARLERAGYHVCVTKEPGGTAVGETIRSVFLTPTEVPMDGLTELLLMFASRRQHLAEVIEPALAAGRVVLCDRFTDSTFAYQGAGRGVPSELIAAVDEIATGARRPDLTLLFDLPASAARERSRSPKRRRRTVGAGGTNRIDEEDVEFYERVRQCFLTRAGAEPGRFRVVDSSGERERTATLVEAALRSCFEGVAEARSGARR